LARLTKINDYDTFTQCIAECEKIIKIYGETCKNLNDLIREEMKRRKLTNPLSKEQIAEIEEVHHIKKVLTETRSLYKIANDLKKIIKDYEDCNPDPLEILQASLVKQMEQYVEGSANLLKNIAAAKAIVVAKEAAVARATARAAARIAAAKGEAAVRASAAEEAAAARAADARIAAAEGEAAAAAEEDA